VHLEKVVLLCWSFRPRSRLTFCFDTKSKQKTPHPLRQYFLLDEKGHDIIQRYEEDNIDTLTDKECEVLRFKYYFDLTTEEIAARLNKSVPTVKSHVQQVMEKLYAPSLHMACVMAKLIRMYE
jgi:DNA-binding CsgD family transcriptional regulator